MFGPRSKSFEQLEHYLEVRKDLRKPSVKRTELAVATVALGLAALISLNDHASYIALLLFTGLAGIFGYQFFMSQRIKAPTREDEVLGKADEVALKLKELSVRRRLHLVLHPGIGAVLNECAVYWKRIQDLSNSRMWADAQLSDQWKLARQEWIHAADFAMAEALLLAEPGLTLRPSRPRPEELVEDLLDTYVFQRPKGRDEVLPANFQPLRDLAEKMRSLAEEVQTAQASIGSERSLTVEADAGERLDQVLSNLRSINEAEEELQKHLKQSS